MGILETNSKQRARKTDLRKAVLVTLKGSVVIGIAAIAPKVLKLLPRNFAKQPSRLNRTFYAMRDAGLIVMEKSGSNTNLRITDAGRAYLKRYTIPSCKESPQKKWDGKWRVVIYDIHESRKGLRRKLYTFIKSYGFIRLQNSVWIYPYDCEDIITLTKVDLRTGKSVLYMIVDSIENDYWLRNSFGLSQN